MTRLISGGVSFITYSRNLQVALWVDRSRTPSPLTLTVSLREREQASNTTGFSCERPGIARAGRLRKREAILPLPKREGWGEGKGIVGPGTRVRSALNVRSLLSGPQGVEPFIASSLRLRRRLLIPSRKTAQSRHTHDPRRSTASRRGSAAKGFLSPPGPSSAGAGRS